MWFFGYARPSDRAQLSAWAVWISCELQQHVAHAQNPPHESYTNLSNSTWPGCHLGVSLTLMIYFAIIYGRRTLGWLGLEDLSEECALADPFARQYCQYYSWIINWNGTQAINHFLQGIKGHTQTRYFLFFSFKNSFKAFNFLLFFQSESARSGSLLLGPWVLKKALWKKEVLWKNMWLSYTGRGCVYHPDLPHMDTFLRFWVMDPVRTVSCDLTQGAVNAMPYDCACQAFETAFSH